MWGGGALGDKQDNPVNTYVSHRQGSSRGAKQAPRFMQGVKAIGSGCAEGMGGTKRQRGTQWGAWWKRGVGGSLAEQPQVALKGQAQLPKGLRDSSKNAGTAGPAACGKIARIKEPREYFISDRGRRPGAASMLKLIAK